jgi:hypothetical protein
MGSRRPNLRALSHSLTTDLLSDYFFLRGQANFGAADFPPILRRPSTGVDLIALETPKVCSAVHRCNGFQTLFAVRATDRIYGPISILATNAAMEQKFQSSVYHELSGRLPCRPPLTE